MGKANLHPNPLSGYSEDYPDDEDVELGEDDFDEPDARCAPIAETTCSALIGTSRKALSGSVPSSAKAVSTTAARKTVAMTKAEGDYLGTGNHPGNMPSRSEVSSALSDLLLRVEGATGPNFALEEEIDRVVGKSGLVVPPAYTGSLDAALALVIRVLPGWWPGFQKNRTDNPKAALSRIVMGRRVECVAGKRSYDRVVASCTLGGRSVGDLMRAAGIREGGRGR